MKVLFKEIISLCLYLAFVFGCTYLTVRFVAQRTEIEGTSMAPALYDGDQVIVDKLTYRWREPERFEIIAFPCRYQQNTFYVKRIIGLPGETVRIDAQGTIFINDEALKEHYGMEVINQPGYAATPRKLEEDEYFVLGDNRNDSVDSRYTAVGLVRRTEIIGRVCLRLYPFAFMELSISYFGTVPDDSEPRKKFVQKYA